MAGKRATYDEHRRDKKTWRASHAVVKGHDTLTLGEWNKARDAEVERVRKEKEEKER